MMNPFLQPDANPSVSDPAAYIDRARDLAAAALNLGNNDAPEGMTT